MGFKQALINFLSKSFAVYLCFKNTKIAVRYFLNLAYNGSAYHGWQMQPNALSVQEVVEAKLKIALQQKISVVGAGRTDAGVHAKELFVHFDVEKNLEPKNFKHKVNTLLPADIAVNSLQTVQPEAHARFDAVSRTYKYFVSTKKNPFMTDFSYFKKNKLDLEAMNQAAKILLDYKDFKCFSKSKTDVNTYNCSIEFAAWQKEESQLVFTIKADRFLRNMVRAIVGTLLEIGQAKMPVENLHQIIKSRNRGQAGTSVAAKGLFLWEIEYPQSIFS